MPMDPATGVATIGGTDHCPAGIGAMQITWTDDAGKLYTYVLDNKLYFPESPVNILSVTKLADFFNDVWHAHCLANLNLATNGFVKEASFEHSQYVTNDENSDKEKELA
eukprot:7905186-Ditylum_brightwellii.AAC.1